MASINQYKNIIDELTGRIDLLKKAIELDPANTISYQATIEYCQSQIDAAKWIAEADKIVNKAKKEEAKDDKGAKESKSKKSATKKSNSKKAEPKVEEPKTDNAPDKPTAEDDLFDLFGD